VITGAAGGIGAATPSCSCDEGATVVGVDLRRAARPGELSLQADVTDEQQVIALYAKVAERFGRIDVLFNNAGISPTDDASVLDTDARGLAAGPGREPARASSCAASTASRTCSRTTGGGSVINTASFVAVMGAATSQISYTASKGGVLALSRELGVEFARSGVRVNALCPGPVDTPLLQELFAKDPERPRGGSCTCRWAASPSRGDRQRAPCSWPATSRAT
jgi:NAD(P)-dependent dehydrogenase (short-subunit alcohol dehydrogenase family)